MKLVTSPFKELYQDKSNTIFLGHWCFLSKEKDSQKIIDYHWLDREKFKNDFNYLNNLVSKINYQLADILNKLNNTSFSKEFWYLIINPWVSMFVSAVYDRWESSNKVLKILKISQVNFLDSEKNSAPKDFDDYLQLYNDHLWNHNVFRDIFEFINSKKFQIKYFKNTMPSKKLVYNKKKYFLKLLIDKIFSFSTRKKHIVFLDSYFSFFNFLKLTLKIGQLPRIYYEFYKDIQLPEENNDLRSKIRLNLNENDFEKFISSYIPKNFPKSFLEGFKIMINEVDKVKIDSNLIITGNANFPTELSKFWCALKKEEKSKIILNEHGGSIPIKYRYYDIHNKIFEKQICWSKPKSKDQIQLSPSKLIGLEKIKSRKKDLSIITLETSQYAYYCRNLQSSLILEDFKQKKQFMEILNSEKIIFKIKTYQDMGWKLDDQYKKLFGKKTIINKDIKSVIKQSKLIVCTYPETTFLESMISGVPTILIFMDNIWNFDDSFKKVVNLLIQNNIIFSCPKKAAKHVKKIINDPKKWWDSHSTTQARNFFLSECGNISDDWLNEWKDFILRSNDKNQ